MDRALTPEDLGPGIMRVTGPVRWDIKQVSNIMCIWSQENREPA